MVVWGVSVDTTILHVPTFLSAPACTACTDIVYSKELERDVSYNYRCKVVVVSNLQVRVVFSKSL